MSLEDKIAEIGLVPVIKITDPAHAAPLAKALIEADLPVAEVTFRTDCAAEAIKIMSDYKELLLGAGTVINAEQVKTAKEAGATYIISPGFSPEVSKACIDEGLIYFLGIAFQERYSGCYGGWMEDFEVFPSKSAWWSEDSQGICCTVPRNKFCSDRWDHCR